MGPSEFKINLQRKHGFKSLAEGGPISSIFMQFLQNFCQIIGLRILLRDWRPTLGNSGFATASCMVKEVSHGDAEFQFLKEPPRLYISHVTCYLKSTSDYQWPENGFVCSVECVP